MQFFYDRSNFTFVSYFLQPVKEVQDKPVKGEETTTFYRPCWGNETPDMFTVYGKDADGLVYAVADFSMEVAAILYQQQLSLTDADKAEEAKEHFDAATDEQKDAAIVKYCREILKHETSEEIEAYRESMADDFVEEITGENEQAMLAWYHDNVFLPSKWDLVQAPEPAQAPKPAQAEPVQAPEPVSEVDALKQRIAELESYLYFSNEQRETLLVSALEGGSNYWYNLKDPLPKVEGMPAQGYPYVEKLLFVLNAGHTVNVYDIEAEDDDDAPLGSISLERMKAAELLMRKDHAVHYNNVIEGDDDAITGDVYFQLCVLGSIVYG